MENEKYNITPPAGTTEIIAESSSQKMSVSVLLEVKPVAMDYMKEMAYDRTRNAVYKFFKNRGFHNSQIKIK